MASFVILWSIVFWVNLHISHGLMCYECTSNDPQSQCVINNGRSVECEAKYCMLYRIESSDGSTAFSLIRACTNVSQSPSVRSSRATKFETHESKYYFRYCSENWCNGGDGTSSKNPQRILFVKGEENAAANYSFVNIFLLVISSLYLIF